MRSTRKILIALLAGLVVFSSCKTDPKPKPPVTPQTTTSQPKPKKPIKIPSFDTELAYKNIKGQLAFGPRVPGTPAHEKTKIWLVNYFKGLGLKVTEQDFDASSPLGEKYTGTNIIASYKPEQSHRLVLASHWDSRYISDQDEKVKDKPVMGADDGASGVGILMAIAQVLRDSPADIGVDFVLFDVEDQGATDQEEDGVTSTWCQGAQYWAQNLPDPDYKPEFGILLDMVGGKDAYFAQDKVSQVYAGPYVTKVWSLARAMGYKQYFQNISSSALIDDHLFVNKIAGIPMMDIINRRNGLFPTHWHTQHDDITAIDKKTIHAVGQVLTAVIYHSSVGNL